MTIQTALLYFIIITAGFTVTGIVGFGGNVLALPILSLFYNLQDIVAIFAFISFINAFIRVIQYIRDISWLNLFLLWAITLPGSFLGTVILHNLPENQLKIALGFFIIAIATYNLTKGHSFATKDVLAKESHIKKIMFQILLFFGGVLQGAFVCGGPIYVIYCSHYFGHNIHKYKGMQFGVMLINSFFVFLSYINHHCYTMHVIQLCIPALLGVGASFLFSAYISKYINNKKLYFLIQCVLIFSGTSLILQSFSAIL